MERPSLEHISENTRNHGGFECCNGCSIAEQVADFALHLEARIRELEGERDVLKADLATAIAERDEYNEERVKHVREVFALRTRCETLSGLLRECEKRICAWGPVQPGIGYDECGNTVRRIRALLPAESGRGKTDAEIRSDHIVMNMGMCPGAKDYDDCQCDACCRARAAESGRGSE